MTTLAIDKEGGRPHRLKNIVTEFLSLVKRGANRQSKFFVVKADEDAEQSAPQADVISEDEVRKRNTNATLPKSTEQQQGVVEEKADSASNADLGAWLAIAGARAKALYTDTVISSATALPVPFVPCDAQLAKAQRIGMDRSAPSEEQSVAEAALAKSRNENADLRRKLAKRDAELRQERLRTTRLKKAAVGGTTALVAGLLDDAADGETDEGAVAKQDRNAWRSGGDLASN